MTKNMRKIDADLSLLRPPCENYLCDKGEHCFEAADAKHHLFSQSKENKETYGKLLNEDFNIIFIVNGCHLWKPIPKFTEIEFRRAAEKAGFGDRLGSASKSMQFREY